MTEKREDYYIYGVDIGANEISYLGFGKEDFPSKMKEFIKAHETYINRRMDFKDSSILDVFPLEKVGSIKEADETLEFWDKYLQFLGAKPVSLKIKE